MTKEDLEQAPFYSVAFYALVLVGIILLVCGCQAIDDAMNPNQ